MKFAVLALALISVTSLARAQPLPPPDADYWRQHHEEEWRRRAEFREEERRAEWVRTHCVRDWRGEEFCRR